jgi:hypothetical protein
MAVILKRTFFVTYQTQRPSNAFLKSQFSSASVLNVFRLGTGKINAKRL